MNPLGTSSSNALLVIDMQLVAFDGKVAPPITDGAQLLHSVSRLIDSFRRNECPIVYLQTSAVSGQPSAEDVHGWEIHPEISPIEGDHVVSKRASSGFDGTGLLPVLKDSGVKKVIVCGVWSEFCVANTCIDARRNGFDVVIAADGHGTVAATVEEARERVVLQNSRLLSQGVSVSTITALLQRR